MGNCINKSSNNIMMSPNGGSEDKLPLSPKATSNSSVATTACITPLSTASESSPPRQPASPDRLDALVSSVAVGSPMSPTIHNNNADDPSNDQRIEGQQQLRDLVVTGAEAGEIDWKSIIKLAEDLHKKEQQQLRSSSSSVISSSSSKGGGKRTNTSKRQAFFERRRKRKELAMRKKRESVGSFSVNLVIHDEGKHRTLNRGEQTNTVGSTGALTNESCATACAASDNNSGKQTVEKEMHGSESEEEIDVFEDDDSESLSSSKAPLSARHSRSASSARASVNMNKPQFIVEGSFMAATTLFDLPKINDDEEDNSSSSNSSTASDTFGRSFTNDGLVTIHEDSSVSTWQQQWQQYLR